MTQGRALTTAFAWLGLAVTPLQAQYECRFLPGRPIGRDTALSGQITEAGTRRPIPHVAIQVDRTFEAASDCEGRFVVSTLTPGPHSLATQADSFLPVAVRIADSGAPRQRLDIQLRRRLPSPAPLDFLQGSWVITFWKGFRPSAQPLVSGSLVVLPGYWIGDGFWYQVIPTLDYIPLWERREHFPELDRAPDTLGVTLVRDSLEMWLTPGLYDNGFMVTGLVNGDSVVGSWCAETNGPCRPKGRVALTRPH
jgi:Carboxypeptidase regulatory-like domain